MKTHALTIVAALLGSAVSARAGAAATQPAAARLSPFLKVIRESDDARTVMRTYTRALAVSRDNAELHRAYVRRMLQFGLPQIAQHAARELVRLQLADGIAWGVLGYMHGRRGELADAFVATLQAAERIPYDPSIQNNAGQLVAWYDFEPDRPRVPDAARRTLAKLRELLAKAKPFERAYEGLKVAYGQQTGATAALDKQVAAAEAEAQAVQRLARDVDSQLQELNDDIDYRNRLIDSLWREVRSGYALWYSYRDVDGRYVYAPNYTRYYHRQELRDRIREEEREIEKLRLKIRRVRRDGQAVLAELARQVAAVNALRDQIRNVIGRVAAKFRWDPPAIDGVVTAERDKIPATVGTPKMKVPSDPQTDAAQSLELAKLYLRHNMSEKAIGLLEMVAREYPKTEAGRQAALLLAALRLKP